MGFARDHAGREQAVRECEALIEQTAGAADAKSAAERAIAFWKLGENLFRLARFDDAVDPLDQAQRMLAGIASLRFLAAQAAATRAICLFQLERFQDALESIDRALEIAHTISELPLPDLVPVALRLRLRCLEHLGLDDAAYAGAETAIEEIGLAEGAAAQGTVVCALTLQGKVSQARGDYEDALSKFNKALVRRIPMEKLPSEVLQAMTGRAALYEQIGDRTRARKGYDAVVGWSQRYPGPTESEAAQAVSEAIAGKERLATKRRSLWPDPLGSVRSL